MDKPVVRSTPISRSKDSVEVPNTSTDLHSDCIAGHCFVGLDPQTDLSSVGSCSSLRDGPTVAFPGSDLLGGAGHPKLELGEIQATWDAAKRRTSLTAATDSSGYAYQPRLPSPGFPGVPGVVEMAYRILNEEAK